ncbi:beta-ketoacyl-[acyl-carrier-protein] synthase family protein [Streptomyces nondiastaticus]|uniref:Beta-ketoacyl-[acyl-carrier-protein] synthase family protein n=1 Tax=Streptomyces nondiastaticus TaxID=3154512 RepID=A0ABW6TQM4_9ACTN
MTSPARTPAVVVTGLGATTPLGGDTAATWAALLAGRSATAALTEEWAAGLPVRIAARAAAEPSLLLDRVEARRLDRAAQFCVVALREAWADAGFTGPAREPGEGDAAAPDAERVGVVIGSGIGGLHTVTGNYDQLRERGPRLVSPVALPMLMANSPAAQASMLIGARAALHAPSTACAAGAEAVAAGLDMIRLGRADVVVVGGADAAVHPLAIAGFANMGALSARHHDPAGASRPFDRSRDGFVMGEGAAVLVLESAEHARARGARVYCELAGAGLSADAHHMARPEPGGRGMASALRKALAEAGLAPADVAHVNAHATSTVGGDLVEGRAISAVLGPGAAPVSAVKSMTGHLLGAAGALGALTSVLALHRRVAPPTANLDVLDEGLDLDVVGSAPRPLPAGDAAVVANASGFGGHNVVLAFRPAA